MLQAKLQLTKKAKLRTLVLVFFRISLTFDACDWQCTSTALTLTNLIIYFWGFFENHPTGFTCVALVHVGTLRWSEMNRNRKINTDLFKIQIYIESKIEKEEQGSEESQIELLQPINSLWSIIRDSQMGPHGNHNLIITARCRNFHLASEGYNF